MPFLNTEVEIFLFPNNFPGWRSNSCYITDLMEPGLFSLALLIFESDFKSVDYNHKRLCANSDIWQCT